MPKPAPALATGSFRERDVDPIMVAFTEDDDDSVRVLGGRRKAKITQHWVTEYNDGRVLRYLVVQTKDRRVYRGKAHVDSRYYTLRYIVTTGA